MPTIIRIANLRFYFFSKEGLRPHIHVGLQSGSKIPEMKIWLDTMEVARISGFSKNAERKIMVFVRQEQAFLLEQWEMFFNE